MPLPATLDVDDPQAERERLARLHAMELVGAAAEPRFDRLTELTAHVLDVPTAAVNLVDDTIAWATSVSGATGPHALPRNLTFCSSTIRGDGPLVIEDASTDPRFRDHPAVTGPARIRFYAGHPLRGPGGYPVGALCVLDTRPRRFGPSERAVLQSLAALVEREINYQDERDRAAETQRGLLPAAGTGVDGWQAAGVCLPAHRVGGDFFDWQVTDRGLALTVGDVMGKGMPAAILASAVRAVLRAEARHRDPVAALAGAAEALQDDLDATGSFASLFHAAFRPDGTVEHADAGHGLAVVARAGSNRIDGLGGTRGLPLGIPGAAAAAGGTARLAAGDTLVAFSDGLLEVIGGVDEARRAAAELARGDLHGLPGRVRVLCGAAARVDDVTVVAVRRTV